MQLRKQSNQEGNCKREKELLRNIWKDKHKINQANYASTQNHLKISAHAWKSANIKT